MLHLRSFDKTIRKMKKNDVNPVKIYDHRIFYSCINQISMDEDNIYNDDSSLH